MFKPSLWKRMGGKSKIKNLHYNSKRKIKIAGNKYFWNRMNNEKKRDPLCFLFVPKINKYQKFQETVNKKKWLSRVAVSESTLLAVCKCFLPREQKIKSVFKIFSFLIAVIVAPGRGSLPRKPWLPKSKCRWFSSFFFLTHKHIREHIK